MSRQEIGLRYGCNPHQFPARAYRKEGSLPFEVLNGRPGYINLLDALNSWQLVKELRQVIELPSAASFKHASPAGAAVSVPLKEASRQAYFIGDVELSPLAVAYSRARGVDRLSSFGDWVALSDRVDVSTARLLSREVSDGVIAPDYEPEALGILGKKKRGGYCILRIDPEYEPDAMESREVFGVTLEQKRNDRIIGPELLENVVTERKAMPEEAVRDLLVATVALKYTQSNSVCLAIDGQVIGVGAGQQNRIACVHLAATKAETWYLRQHPALLDLRFRKGLKRSEKINAIEVYLRGEMTSTEREVWQQAFETVPEDMAVQTRQDRIAGLTGVSLSSDAYFPFRDNIDRAARSGVSYVVQAGGSINDEDVISAANAYGMVMALSGVRLFHH